MSFGVMQCALRPAAAQPCPAVDTRYLLSSDLGVGLSTLNKWVQTGADDVTAAPTSMHKVGLQSQKENGLVRILPQSVSVGEECIEYMELMAQAKAVLRKLRRTQVLAFSVTSCVVAIRRAAARISGAVN
jgi:hypothetical protein